MLWLTRHQGHSVLPYQPAPSYFIHKTGPAANRDRCFFFFFPSFMGRAWRPAPGAAAPVARQYLHHCFNLSVGSTNSLSYVNCSAHDHDSRPCIHSKLHSMLLTKLSWSVNANYCRLHSTSSLHRIPT